MGSAGVPLSARSPFASLLRQELRQAFRARHATALIAIFLMGVMLAFWLPRFPESVHRFFQRVFQLDGWPEIVAANDLAGLFFFTHWVGVFEILRIYIVPLEERYLDLFLSKPLRRHAYMLARTVPVMLLVIGLGIVSAMVHWLTLCAAGLDYSFWVYFGLQQSSSPGRCASLLSSKFQFYSSTTPTRHCWSPSFRWPYRFFPA
jgi:hypothetical protein